MCSLINQADLLICSSIAVRRSIGDQTFVVARCADKDAFSKLNELGREQPLERRRAKLKFIAVIRELEIDRERSGNDFSNLLELRNWRNFEFENFTGFLDYELKLIAISVSIDGKYHMLSSGELMILNITREDAERSYRCRTHHRLTQETVVSSNVGRLQLTGECVKIRFVPAPVKITRFPRAHSSSKIHNPTELCLSCGATIPCKLIDTHGGPRGSRFSLIYIYEVARKRERESVIDTENSTKFPEIFPILWPFELDLFSVRGRASTCACSKVN